MKSFDLLLCFLAAIPYNYASVLPRGDDQNRLRPHHVIHQFPAGTWIENLAVRSTGPVLATDDTHAAIYQVDNTGEHEVVLVHKFTETASILGIVETSPDVFHVCTANYSSAKLASYGEDYIYRLDLQNFSSDSTSSAEVSKIATVAHAGALDGLTYVADSGLLLVSDFLQGVIWSVNISTGIVAVATNNTNTQSSGFAVNGLRALGNKIYFTNTGKELFARIPIDRKGHAIGEVEVLTEGGDFLPDDFALDLWGNAYITSFANDTNGIVYVPADGNGPTHIANITGPTSAAFGRTMDDCHILYVSTTGGDYDTSPDGAFIGRGAIVGVDLGEKARQECRQFLLQLSWLGVARHG